MDVCARGFYDVTFAVCKMGHSPTAVFLSLCPQNPVGTCNKHSQAVVHAETPPAGLLESSVAPERQVGQIYT